MRTTIILAAVAVGLALFILVVERRRPSSDEVRAERTHLVPRFDRSAVRRVTIRRPGRPVFSVERDGPAWRFMPGDKPADDAAVDELLAEIDFAETDRIADLTPVAAGLAPAAVAVDLEPEHGEQIQLRLGRPDATGRGVFAQREGDEPPYVRVAPRRLLDLAARDGDAYRDRRVIPAALVPSGDLTLTWTSPGSSEWRALRFTDGRFWNVRQEWVSGERVTEALRRLAELRAARFVPAPAAPPPEGRKLEVLRWTLAAREGEHACDPSLILLERRGREGSDWMCVAADGLKAAFDALDAAHARDARLIASAPDDVTEIELADGARRVGLRREHGLWTLVEPHVAYHGDRDAIADWLAELGHVTLDLGPTGGRAPATRRLTISGRVRESFAVSAPRGDLVNVARGGEAAGAGARAPAALFALLDPDAVRFRSRLVLDVSRYDARALRITAAGAGATTAIVNAGGDSWQVQSPAGARLDGAAFDRLLGTLTNLRALRFLPRATRVAPETTLELTLSRGASAPLQRFVLDLGARAGDGGCSARLASDDKAADAMFTLAPATCDDLQANAVVGATAGDSRRPQ
jgi:hypothetical protein